MKWYARVETEVTFDFEIEANSEEEVEAKIHKYLPFIEGGKLKKQPITVKVGKDDKLTNIFVMGTEIEDAFELDESFADRGM